MRHDKHICTICRNTIDHATMVRKKGLQKTKAGLSQRPTNAAVYLPRLKMIAKADNVNGGRKKAEKSKTFGK